MRCQFGERQPVTPQMAIRFGKLCGNDPEIRGRMRLPLPRKVQ
jgi:plasmid maintenance system antidote protein VapI